MKSAIPHAVLAVLMAAAASLAGAQQPPSRNVAAPAPATRYVAEPTASASKTDGADGELAARIVEALNADRKLADSKITVSPENGNVTLTGSTMTRDQARLAEEIANAQVGQGKVVNAIQHAEI
jgi:osmotically-inducible protein OsmY